MQDRVIAHFESNNNYFQTKDWLPEITDAMSMEAL
jgi:hypothetical protein